MVLKNFCLLFVFLSLSINANAQMTHEIGGIWYNLYPGGYMYYTGCVMEDNTAEVVGLYQDFDKVYIPSEVTLGNLQLKLSVVMLLKIVLWSIFIFHRV